MDNRDGVSTNFRIDIKEVPAANNGSLVTSKRIQLQQPLGTEILAVPKGEVLDINLELQEVDQGILVTFDSTAKAVGQCSRCLEDIILLLTINDAQLYFYRAERDKLITEGDEEAEDALVIDGESIDLEGPFRDAAIPQIPYQPLCDENCRGLCPDCGEPYRQLPPDHHHKVADPRFSALKDFFKDSND